MAQRFGVAGALLALVADAEQLRGAWLDSGDDATSKGDYMDRYLASVSGGANGGNAVASSSVSDTTATSNERRPAGVDSDGGWRSFSDDFNRHHDAMSWMHSGADSATASMHDNFASPSSSDFASKPSSPDFSASPLEQSAAARAMPMTFDAPAAVAASSHGASASASDSSAGSGGSGMVVDVRLDSELQLKKRKGAWGSVVGSDDDSTEVKGDYMDRYIASSSDSAEKSGDTWWSSSASKGDAPQARSSHTLSWMFDRQEQAPSTAGTSSDQTSSSGGGTVVDVKLDSELQEKMRASMLQDVDRHSGFGRWL